MLFYSFRVECQYSGKQTMEKAFVKSRLDGERSVCVVNDLMCADIDDGKCALIYHGAPHVWHLIAAFKEKGFVSMHTLRDLLASSLRNKGGVTDFTVSELREITVREFCKAVEKADSFGYLDNCHRQLSHMDLDFLAPSSFKLREEVYENDIFPMEKALAHAKEILADETLLNELKRIYSDENVREFHGHPVHYKVTAGNQNAAMEIVRILNNALYSCGRLLSRRVSLIGEIRERCYDDSDLRSIFKQAAGSTIVIELRGANEEHGNYASVYEEVAAFIAELVEKHHRDVLCVFVEYTDNPGFTPLLMSKVEEHIDTIEIHEGAGNREDAKKYLRRLVKEADFEVMDEEEINEAVAGKTLFSSSEIYRIYNKFHKSGIKNKLYRAYKTAKYVVAEKEKKSSDAYDRLQKMIGLSEMKQIVDQIIAAYKVQKMRSSMGIAKESVSLHMLFTGNPGSAKTTVARLLAEILKKEGILESGGFVECGRSDLVGKYVGWTAKVVKEKFHQARGGILFIDEAYALVDDSNSFGDEAINTIVQEMENLRGKVVVIFAGYKDKMEDLLAKNEGLRSRIAFHVDFPDYNAEELTEILSLMAEDRGFNLAEPVRRKCRAIFMDACRKKEFGNGRFARNLLEQAVMKQSQRIMREHNGEEISREDLLALVPEDFEVNAKQYVQDAHPIGFCG